MKLQLAALNVIGLLVFIYVLSGVAIYFTDIARDWCGSDPFDWYTSIFYALLWPLRFLSSGSFCS